MPRRVTKVLLVLVLFYGFGWSVTRTTVQNVDEFITRVSDHRTNRVEDLTTWKISTFKWRRLAMALAHNKSMLYVTAYLRACSVSALVGLIVVRCRWLSCRLASSNLKVMSPGSIGCGCQLLATSATCLA